MLRLKLYPPVKRKQIPLLRQIFMSGVLGKYRRGEGRDGKEGKGKGREEKGRKGMDGE